LFRSTAPLISLVRRIVADDLFDVAWKSNQMNVALLERHLGEPVATRRASRWLVTGVVVVAIGVFVLAGVGKDLLVGPPLRKADPSLRSG
jgi:hypothetical protein